MKVVIVGGVAGGATAAARIRRLNEKAQIIIFERSNFVSYANCGLPYYIGGIIEKRGDLTLQTPESFWNRFRIKVHVRHEVISIDPSKKVVKVCDLNDGEIYEESYDKLILSPGAIPKKPEVRGVENERVFSLRTMEDTFHIQEFIKTQNPKSVVIAGGGYIGVEMAENLKKSGLDVTIVQRLKQLLNSLDYDMATIVHSRIKSKDIKIKFESLVVGFEQKENSILTLLENGKAIQSDMVILAIGVLPDTRLAKDTGLKLGINESIVVNEYMETSISDIYAVGDAVEVTHSVTGKKDLISLAGPANKQGRIAADNICGGKSKYMGSQGTSIIKIFDMTVATTGINERMAKEAGINYDKIVLSPLSHAGYYPGGKVMTIKAIYSKDTKQILGAQIVGQEGVDKRIDIIATAIYAKMSVIQLKEIELSYAPPYSSAKDPVNMIGFMAENLIENKVKQFHWQDIKNLPRDGSVTLLDTRTVDEYNKGHIEDFINIPLDDLRGYLGKLDLNKPVYVICQSGLRSYIACRILSQNGFECYNFSGGYRFYRVINSEICVKNDSYPCGMEK